MAKKNTGPSIKDINNQRESLKILFNMSESCNNCYCMRVSNKGWYCIHEQGEECSNADKLLHAYSGKFKPPKVKHDKQQQRLTLLGDN